MARPRLTDEEREERRKERSRHTFSNAAYKHYDTSQGYGSSDEWKTWAEQAFGTHADTESFFTAPEAKADGLSKQQRADLTTLLLDKMPVDIAAFKRAYKNVMLVAHPDHGGSHEQMVEVNLAVERLLKFYK